MIQAGENAVVPEHGVRALANAGAAALERLPRSITVGRRGAEAFVSFIDQTKLPGALDVVETRDWRRVVDAIKVLAVRGAPALGVAGAAALMLWSFEDRPFEELHEVAETIATARPTAVNLRWGVERALGAIAGRSPLEAREVLFELSGEMIAEDERVNRQIGANGARLFDGPTRVLTHCNAGSLATAYFGTALGVVYTAFDQGNIERVYADETRPLGQGARLTAWELSRAGVPVTLLCDDMAASLMSSGAVDAVIVGADRIALNGDVANKIGTYGVAVLAHEHGIPLYVAAPLSTCDPSMADGSQIVIEQRSPEEVLPVPMEGVEVYNPAFDVTPARFVSKIITEAGVFAPDGLSEFLQSRIRG